MHVYREGDPFCYKHPGTNLDSGCRMGRRRTERISNIIFGSMDNLGALRGIGRRGLCEGSNLFHMMGL